jgi:hypothetical protein
MNTLILLIIVSGYRLCACNNGAGTLSIVTRLRVGLQGFDSRQGGIFPFATFRPVLKLTQLHIQWLLELFPDG